jgi:hypothetical protein
MPDSQDKLIAATLARYRQLCADAAKVQALQRELMAQINDCFAAARVFKFDLVAEAERAAAGDPRQPYLGATDPAAHALFSVPTSPIAPGAPSVKALVLEAAEKAYPGPVRALGVRRELENRGYTIHEKTVGMTLYRWSVDGCTQRIGRDWYFVPPDQRSTKVNGRHYQDQTSEFVADQAV